MIFESIFMIRGEEFGQDFSIKLIMSIIAIIFCLYDWKTNERKDYFWVFLAGTIFWSLVELSLQQGGTRVLQQKFLFGIDITSMPWLTIPLQGISEGAFVAVIGVFFGDRILNEETRKKGIQLFAAYLLIFALLNLINFNIGYADVKIGDPNVPSRREMFNVMSVVFIIFMSGIALIWMITRESTYVRNRGLMMWLIMALFIAEWTLFSWITGDRWIEMGTVNSNGTYSNLRHAPAGIEFLALFYDVVIEVSLIYVPFLTVPYLLGLIKSEEA